MIVYKASVSPLVVKGISLVIGRACRMIFRLLRFLLGPVRFLGRKTGRFFAFSGRKGKKVGKCVKNKLTGKLKLLKITLCKH